MSTPEMRVDGIKPIETNTLYNPPALTSSEAFNSHIAQQLENTPAEPPQGEQATLQRAKQLGTNAEKQYSLAFQDQLPNIKQVIEDNWNTIVASEKFSETHPEVKTQNQFFSALDNALDTSNNEIRFSPIKEVQKAQSLLKVAQGELFEASKEKESGSIEKKALNLASDYLYNFSNLLLPRYQSSKLISEAPYSESSSKKFGEAISSYENHLSQLNDLVDNSEKILTQYTVLSSPLVQ